MRERAVGRVTDERVAHDLACLPGRAHEPVHLRLRVAHALVDAPRPDRTRLDDVKYDELRIPFRSQFNSAVEGTVSGWREIRCKHDPVRCRGRHCQTFLLRFVRVVFVSELVSLSPNWSLSTSANGPLSSPDALQLARTERGAPAVILTFLADVVAGGDTAPSCVALSRTDVDVHH